MRDDLVLSVSRELQVLTLVCYDIGLEVAHILLLLLFTGLGPLGQVILDRPFSGPFSRALIHS